MSTDDPLTERDQKLIENMGQQVEQAEEPEEYEAVCGELTGRFEALLRELRTFQGDVKGRLSALEDGQGDAKAEAAEAPHTLAKYAAMPESERGSLLSASQRRAVEIYENWDDLAEAVQAGYAISTHRSSTKKHGGSQVKSDLNTLFDVELEWPQIYRAMKAVAKLSGGTEVSDSYGRVHVQGGVFEYHEKPTPDAQSTYKVLVEAGSQ